MGILIAYIINNEMSLNNIRKMITDQTIITGQNNENIQLQFAMVDT